MPGHTIILQQYIQYVVLVCKRNSLAMAFTACVSGKSLNRLHALPLFWYMCLTAKLLHATRC